MSLTFVTTVSKSYIPLARVLMNSVAEQHPQSRRIVVVLDGGSDVDGAVPHAEVIRPSQLIPDEGEVMALQYMYKPIEYATSLKAKLLKYALAAADQVVFVDPDMRLFQPMTAALERLRDGTGTLLTTHRLVVPAYRDRVLYEWACKAYGTYNTGFVGVTDASMPLLDWWDSRLRRECLDDLPNFEWVDQKVMDLAPAYFEFDLLRDFGYNVGWWNLDERPIRKDASGTWTAGDTPLVLMHYSGVRPNRGHSDLPYLVHSAANPVVKDAEHLAALGELERGYVAELIACGYDEFANLEYGFATTPDGRFLSPAARRAYRKLIMQAEAAGDPLPRPDDISWTPAARANRSIRSLRSPGALVGDARGLWSRRQRLPR